MSEPQHSRSEWADGWAMLAASSLGVGTTWIFFQITSGLFIMPMQEEFGWSRAELTIGPLTGLIVGACLPFVGAFIDRFGPRRLALCGAVGLALGFVLLSQLPAQRGLYYAIIVYLAIVGSMCSSVVFSSGLAGWFRHNFGAAVGVMMTGISLASAFGIPLLSGIIETYGWRNGFLALAVMVACVTVPVLALKFKERRIAKIETGPEHSPVNFSVLVRSKSLWHIMAATLLASLSIGGFLAHIQPLLVELGMARATAALFGSVFVVAIGVGRLSIGVLLDRAHAPSVSSGSLVLSAIGAAILFSVSGETHSLWTIAIAISLIGLAQGAESDYLKFFALRLFDLGRFARVLALMSMAASAGMALGGLAFAAAFDRFGDYRIAIAGGAACYLAAAVLFGRIRMGEAPAPAPTGAVRG